MYELEPSALGDELDMSPGGAVGLTHRSQSHALAQHHLVFILVYFDMYPKIRTVDVYIDVHILACTSACMCTCTCRDDQ